MTDLAAVLAQFIDAFDTATDAADAPEQIGASMTCSFEVYLTEPDTDGPTVTAHAAILPGGAVAETYLEASQDGETATREIQSGTVLHRALQDAFTDMWEGWDEVPDQTPGEVLAVRAADLLPGDLVWRLGMTVTRVEESGTDAGGQAMVTVRFEGTDGTERWSAEREPTIIR